jgi:hypothetical protein
VPRNIPTEFFGFISAFAGFKLMRAQKSVLAQRRAVIQAGRAYAIRLTILQLYLHPLVGYKNDAASGYLT